MRFHLDVHCHTTASGHAFSSLDQMLERANDLNLELCGISDHGPAMPGSCSLSYFLEILKLPNFHKKINWIKGVEVNILDNRGKCDVPDEILSKLDYAIASIHTGIYNPGYADANTTAIIKIMKNQHINIIGHLGDPNVPIIIQPIIEAAKETGTIIEINNKSLKPGHRRYDGGATIREILIACKNYNVPIIAGSDAHKASEVGKLRYAKSFIKKSGISEELVMNTNTKRFLKTLKGKQVK